MFPPVEVSIRTLLARAGRWPRSELRRARGTIRWEGIDHPLTGRVLLDGRWSRLEFREVELEARLALPPVFLMDKPEGVITSRVPEHGAPTVFEALTPEAARRVEPVGRLDRNSSGLLLLAGDGALIQRLTHPKWEVPRSYRVEVRTEPDPEVIRRLRAGDFELRDGHRPRPVELAPIATGQWEVTLSEGKYHEVRRMFGAAGSRVVALRRTRFACFTLEDLRGRPVRRLEEEEVLALYASLPLPHPTPEPEIREAPPRASWG